MKNDRKSQILEVVKAIASRDSADSHAEWFQFIMNLLGKLGELDKEELAYANQELRAARGESDTA